MTCEEARMSMHFHLDGDDHPHVARARKHADSCAHCERHLLDLKEVESGLRHLERYTAPPGLKERILSMTANLPQKRRMGL